MIEENIGNNRLMTAAMQAQGYRATLHETPGGHDFPAWRDAFDPPLAAARGSEAGLVNGDQAVLWSDEIGARGTVIRYGH